MKIIKDESYISSFSRKFVEHGLAEIDLHSVRFSFEYNEEQREQNFNLAQQLSSTDWASRCDEEEKRRSKYMYPVMDKIAQNFVCYQFNQPSHIKFSSIYWDLFFWSNNLSADSHENDYSYFTLTFNDRHTPADRAGILNRLMDLLNENFSHLENLTVYVQYSVSMHVEEIEEVAKQAKNEVVGSRVHFHGLKGKVVENPRGVFFMKERARTKGYLLDKYDIISILWSIEEQAG